jgi:hypothetical protein
MASLAWHAWFHRPMINDKSDRIVMFSCIEVGEKGMITELTIGASW